MAVLTETDELRRDNVGRYVGLRQGKDWERTEYSDYYCGGCGWKVTDHDSYCPECGGALHKAAIGSCNCTNNCTNSERMETSHADGKLSAQCDKLRAMAEGIGFAVPQAATLMKKAADTIDRLGGENAKLREYAKLMHDHIKECCDVCGVCSICDIDALTRSLGIEMDE